MALREWLGRDGIDCLFLDGDKAEFLADFRTYRPLLAKAGVVFVHDITDDVPGEAFHRMEGRSKQRLIDRTDWELSKRRGGDPSCAHEAWLRHWQGRSCGVGVVYL